jgi:hypothetical protein
MAQPLDDPVNDQPPQSNKEVMAPPRTATDPNSPASTYKSAITS